LCFSPPTCTDEGRSHIQCHMGREIHSRLTSSEDRFCGIGSPSRLLERLLGGKDSLDLDAKRLLSCEMTMAGRLTAELASCCSRGTSDNKLVVAGSEDVTVPECFVTLGQCQSVLSHWDSHSG